MPPSVSLLRLKNCSDIELPFAGCSLLGLPVRTNPRLAVVVAVVEAAKECTLVAAAIITHQEE